MKKLKNLALRLAAPADAALIATLSRELIETGLGWSWTPERVLRCLRHRDTMVLTARDSERLAGFAIMLFGEERAHLSLLAVRLEYQDQGVGRRMLDWLTESALTAGISSIHLELRERNLAARRFYLRQGFAETARIPGYYRGVETAVRMLRDIRVKAP
jgi:[ribosomal protein S18]-alanine N-acetyltransferase